MASREMYDVLKRLKELDKNNPNLSHASFDSSSDMLLSFSCQHW